MEKLPTYLLCWSVLCYVSVQASLASLFSFDYDEDDLIDIPDQPKLYRTLDDCFKGCPEYCFLKGKIAKCHKRQFTFECVCRNEKKTTTTTTTTTTTRTTTRPRTHHTTHRMSILNEQSKLFFKLSGITDNDSNEKDEIQVLTI
ncbi:hypothetical protein M8J75_004326 [Diaphorina citri]|nr:hypothetical protein M8J75_004326 [Diaphorina citri]